MRVLVIAKSRRDDGFSLIGFVNETQQIIRILNSGGEYFPKDTKFEHNSVWEMKYSNKEGFSRPHVEDVIIDEYEFIGKLADFSKVMYKRLPKFEEGFARIFDGYLKPDNNNFMSLENFGTLPVNSLEAIVAEFDIVWDSKKSAYKYTFDNHEYFLKYSGSEIPQELIPEGSVILLELSPWKKENGKEICYLELAAWCSEIE